jgi:hypothetical protein
MLDLTKFNRINKEIDDKIRGKVSKIAVYIEKL